MKKLQNKVALITGGNSGIGRATARRFADEGAFVYVVARREAELAETIAEIGARAAAIQADVTRMDDLDAIYARIAADGRRLDILVANAGRVERVLLPDVDADHFDRIFDLNVRAAYFTVQKSLPILNDGASVIMVSSSLNVRGDAGASVYNASKAAVRSLVRTFATELLPRCIRVNTLSPGPVDTPIIDTQAPTPEAVAAFREYAAGVVPMKRMGRPEEVAAGALFLASDESSFSTGTELRVDGGHAELSPEG
ncbi:MULTISPECIES: glucose 1-dehydrogenase [unclassified Chelatococcus]|uniref:glucose 1-dehydrogenase n=1 Tax=unclassified Chelatococcus TaxID=2638111 RepID=UPI001BCC74AD|nr:MULTISPECIES: glucose 1-dehydrogenase [unclassified Chelatococcus]MBS7697490.1 glucose 1-dehydrogenase [Chelatococcus sp. YT9]MBX3559435.1 glucose 1-dehydrogenase [Chelatococcus sp.]